MTPESRDRLIIVYRVVIGLVTAMAGLFSGLILYSLDARINQAVDSHLSIYQTKEDTSKYQMVSREFSDLSLKRIEDRLADLSRRQEVNEQNTRTLVEMKENIAGIRSLVDLLISDMKTKKGRNNEN